MLFVRLSCVFSQYAVWFLNFIFSVSVLFNVFISILDSGFTSSIVFEIFIYQPYICILGYHLSISFLLKISLNFMEEFIFVFLKLLKLFDEVYIISF